MHVLTLLSVQRAHCCVSALAAACRHQYPSARSASPMHAWSSCCACSTRCRTAHSTLCERASPAARRQICIATAYLLSHFTICVNPPSCAASHIHSCMQAQPCSSLSVSTARTHLCVSALAQLRVASVAPLFTITYIVYPYLRAQPPYTHACASSACACSHSLSYALTLL